MLMESNHVSCSKFECDQEEGRNVVDRISRSPACSESQYHCLLYVTEAPQAPCKRRLDTIPHHSLPNPLRQGLQTLLNPPIRINFIGETLFLGGWPHIAWPCSMS